MGCEGLAHKGGLLQCLHGNVEDRISQRKSLGNQSEEAKRKT